MQPSQLEAMSAVDTDLDQTRAQVHAALGDMLAGDPRPYADLWADDQDVTLFGAWGPIERGHAPVTKTFQWVGSRSRRASWRWRIPWCSPAVISPIRWASSAARCRSTAVRCGR